MDRKVRYALGIDSINDFATMLERVSIDEAKFDANRVRLKTCEAISSN